MRVHHKGKVVKEHLERVNRAVKSSNDVLRKLLGLHSSEVTVIWEETSGPIFELLVDDSKKHGKPHIRIEPKGLGMLTERQMEFLFVHELIHHHAMCTFEVLEASEKTKPYIENFSEAIVGLVLLFVTNPKNFTEMTLQFRDESIKENIRYLAKCLAQGSLSTSLILDLVLFYVKYFLQRGKEAKEVILELTRMKTYDFLMKALSLALEAFPDMKDEIERIIKRVKEDFQPSQASSQLRVSRAHH